MKSKLILPSLILLLSGCKVSLNIAGNGAGGIYTAIDGDAICANTVEQCLLEAPIGAVITLFAIADTQSESEFSYWEGDCEGESDTCSFTITGNHSVGAVFNRPDYVESAEGCGTPAANARCLSPTQTPEYYIDQSIKYFLTMESSVSPLVIPNYAPRVVRWEWPPWLLLTGYQRFNLIWTDIVLKLNPTAYAVLNCQAFDVQPFGRCHVVFDYSGELCPIYEEFTFNDEGQITFIEAWTDQPGWTPTSDDDYWAQENIPGRLANRVPGLGTETGWVDWDGEAMQEAISKDADVAELVKRVKDPYKTWFQELITHTQELAEGCDPDHIAIELD